MDEHQAAAKVAPLRSVLRVLFLAGAAVVAWLLISGGPAHAGDSSATEPGAHPLVTAAVVTGPARALPHPASEVVDKVAARAPASARAAEQGVSAALATTLTATTAGLANTIERAAGATDAVVDHVLHRTGLHAPSQQTSSSPSSAAPTPVASPRDRVGPQHRPDPGAEAAGEASSVVLAGDHSSGSADRSAGTDPPAVPPGPDAPGSPSTIAVGAAAALLVGLLVLAPPFLRRLGLADSDPLPAGPSYPPGTSPD